MEIDGKNAIEILNKNFNYEKVNTIFGTAIKMNCYDAFIFSNVTGAGYLDNYVMPFSPKGLLKIFYNAFNYNFVTGIFDNGSLKYSPYNLSVMKPYLFKKYKYILFVEFDSEEKLRKILKEMIEKCDAENIASTDFIVYRIEKSKKGNGMESFMEYLACEYFKVRGYIVENQVPLAATVGSPDFAGYSLCELSKYDSVAFFSNLGFHIIELAMIRIFNKENSKDLNLINNNNNIVGEAKTSTKIMASQLQKYLDTGLFKIGFELHPDKNQASNNSFGLLSLKNNVIKVTYPEIINIYQEKYNQKEYELWLLDYIKFYLISNLTNDELCDFYYKYNDEKMTMDSLAKFIHTIKIELILNKIEEVI